MVLIPLPPDCPHSTLFLNASGTCTSCGMETEVSLMRDDIDNPCQRLLDHMCCMSQDLLCSGFSDSVPLYAWQHMIGAKKYDWPDADIEKLRELSKACNGWIESVGHTGVRFIPLPLWELRCPYVRSESIGKMARGEFKPYPGYPL